MVITWIGYCLLVSALLGLAALASERALGHYRKPVRWAWFAAIAGSATAPIVAFLAPGCSRAPRRCRWRRSRGWERVSWPPRCPPCRI